jgi:hypothetical protein
VITLCSVSPDSYRIVRYYMDGPIIIPPAPDSVGYSTCTISDHKDYKVVWTSLTENETMEFPVPAKVIVADIIGAEQLDSKGVFALPEGRTVPTDKELATARRKRREQLVAWATDGDRLYSQFGTRGIQHIPDVSKRAVLELKQKRDWVFSPDVVTKECEVCGDTLKPLANGKYPILCKGCGAVIDEDAYAQKKFATAEPKKKMGRPKKVVEEQPQA